MDDDRLLATPTPLTEFVSYQTGSVVSRVLFRNQGGVVTLFAFDESQGLTEHSTPHDATLLVVDGEVKVTVGQDDHVVREGEILHLPASVPHTLHEGERFKMLLTLLKKPSAGRPAAPGDA